MMRLPFILFSLLPLSLALRAGDKPDFSAKVAAIPLPAGTGAMVPDKWFANSAGLRAAMGGRATATAPMFVYFYTGWCDECKISDRLWESSAVQMKLNGVYRVKIDAEIGGAEGDLARSVGARKFPSCRWFEAGGETAKEIPCGPTVTPEAFIAWIDNDPDGAIRWVNAAHGKLQARDFAGALVAADKALAAAPGDAALWIVHGAANAGLGNTSGAETDFLRALRIDGRNADACRQLDILYAADKRFADAVAVWDFHLKFVPTDGEGWFALGRAWLRLEEKHKARKAYKAACERGYKPGCDAAD